MSLNQAMFNDYAQSRAGRPLLYYVYSEPQHIVSGPCIQTPEGESFVEKPSGIWSAPQDPTQPGRVFVWDGEWKDLYAYSESAKEWHHLVTRHTDASRPVNVSRFEWAAWREAGVSPNGWAVV